MTTFLPMTEYLPTFTAPRSPRIIAPGITTVCKTSSQLVEIQDCKSLLEISIAQYLSVQSNVLAAAQDRFSADLVACVRLDEL